MNTNWDTHRYVRMCEWTDLQTLPNELRPSLCLTTGQSFAWKHVCNELGQKVENSWIGVIGQKVICIRENQTTTEFRSLLDNSEACSKETSWTLCDDTKAETRRDTDIDVRDLLHSYFQLNVKTQKLFDRWSSTNTFLSSACERFQGFRVLKQDLLETIIAFICSSNNNLSRITLLVDRFRSEYGTPLVEVPGPTSITAISDGHCSTSAPTDSISPFLEGKLYSDQCGKSNCVSSDLPPYTFYAFPNLSQLRTVSEKRLRELGFGYRSKYVFRFIQRVIQEVVGKHKQNSQCTAARNKTHDKGLADSEHELQSDITHFAEVSDELIDKHWESFSKKLISENNSLDECRNMLIKYDGIGPKVADCVSLYSLGQTESVPVDVHVWRAAKRDFEAFTSDATLNSKTYHNVQSLYRKHYSPYAGWAQGLVFLNGIREVKSKRRKVSVEIK